MRIWSLHPKYLDAKGLVALWRETLLAKKVLENKTKGYKNHPQLLRFKASDPLNTINYYLKEVYLEAQRRSYNFDKSKFTEVHHIDKINVTTSQIAYEKNHLLKKLKSRDDKKYQEVLKVSTFEVHPLFNLVEGQIEDWEKL